MKNIIRHTPYKNIQVIGRNDIFIKLECEQFGKSFKSRGIFNFLQHAENLNGVVTFTTGNHGIALAAIAEKLGIKAIIVSSKNLTIYKRKLIESFGATIQFVDSYSLDEATSFAKKVADEMNFTFVPLFGNEHLLNGYSQITQEICNDFTGNLTMYFPIGSGSLLLANARLAKKININNQINGVEPFIYQRLNKVKEHNNPSLSMADCLSIDRIPICNQELLRYTDNIDIINEDDIRKATKLIYDHFNIMTEPGGAITLAAAYPLHQPHQLIFSNAA